MPGRVNARLPRPHTVSDRASHHSQGVYSRVTRGVRSRARKYITYPAHDRAPVSPTSVDYVAWGIAMVLKVPATKRPWNAVRLRGAGVQREVT